VTVVATRPATRFDERLVALLTPWLPGRRWYPAKGAAAELTPVGVLAFPDQDDDALRVLLVRVVTAAVDVVLQVPLVVGGPDDGDGGPDGVVDGDGDRDRAGDDDRDRAGDDDRPAAPRGPLIGYVDGLPVRDGAGDAAYLTAFLAAADGPGADLDPASGRVITGEQSNTSVVLRGPAGGSPVAICKVLRTVAAGSNPDVDIPRRLVEVGWDGAPTPLAWLVGRWPGEDGSEQEGYLGAVSAFVPDAEDGFELACTWARAGRSFAGPAGELGALVAGMHDALRRGFGVLTGDDDPGPAGVAAALAARYAWAAPQVGHVAAYAEAVAGVVARVHGLTAAPARQRVHGDLHLGQVLRSGDRWFVTDFEGEPLAPLADRTRPDLAVRDLAGLLRSYDYAAAVGGLTGAAALAWSDEARTATLSRYDELAGTTLAAGTGAPALLLAALELDKALYEAVYEQRNRPDWLPIPLAGLHRLLRLPA